MLYVFFFSLGAVKFLWARVNWRKILLRGKKINQIIGYNKPHESTQTSVAKKKIQSVQSFTHINLINVV